MKKELFNSLTTDMAKRELIERELRFQCATKLLHVVKAKGKDYEFLDGELESIVSAVCQDVEESLEGLGVDTNSFYKVEEMKTYIEHYLNSNNCYDDSPIPETFVLNMIDETNLYLGNDKEKKDGIRSIQTVTLNDESKDKDIYKFNHYLLCKRVANLLTERHGVKLSGVIKLVLEQAPILREEAMKHQPELTYDEMCDLADEYETLLTVIVQVTKEIDTWALDPEKLKKEKAENSEWL